MGAKRLGDETTSGGETTRGKRPGGKRLGGETTRGGNGLGAKRPEFYFGRFIYLIQLFRVHRVMFQESSHRCIAPCNTLSDPPKN